MAQQIGPSSSTEDSYRDLPSGLSSHASTLNQGPDPKQEGSHTGRATLVKPQPTDSDSIKGKKRFSRRHSKNGLSAVFWYPSWKLYTLYAPNTLPFIFFALLLWCGWLRFYELVQLLTATLIISCCIASSCVLAWYYLLLTMFSFHHISFFTSGAVWYGWNLLLKPWGIYSRFRSLLYYLFLLIAGSYGVFILLLWVAFCKNERVSPSFFGCFTLLSQRSRCI